MQNCEVLYWYGVFVIALTGSLIVVPYLRGTSSLLSGWNILLLGLAIYLGLGSIDASLSPIRFHGLQWFQPTWDEVSWLLMAATMFLAALIGTYYANPLSSVTARTLNKWPSDSSSLYLTVIVGCLVIVALVPLTLNIFFVGRVILNLSHHAIIFAVTFACLLWNRNRWNPAWLALFIGSFIAAAMLSMMFGAGRRLLLGVFLAPVACVYMTYVRHWRPTRGMVMVGLALVGLLVVGFMYNSIRRTGALKQRTVADVVEGVRTVHQTAWFASFVSDVPQKMAQENVHYALLTNRYVSTGQLEAKPLNSLLFLISYPIPRQIWPEKPQVVGITIVHDVVGWTSTNWGVNIVGHVAYEGGLWVAVLYGVLTAVGLRFLDDPLRRHPTNPFLIAIFASTAPHILGWTRGDIGVMTTEIMEPFLIAILLAIACRLLFGTAPNVQQSHSIAANIPTRYKLIAR